MGLTPQKGKVLYGRRSKNPSKKPGLFAPKRPVRVAPNSRRRPGVVSSHRPHRSTVAKSDLGQMPASRQKLRINILRLKPGLGDITMITPAFVGLREKFPNAEITATVRSTYVHDTRQGSKYGIVREALEYFPYVDKIVDLDKPLKNDSYNFSVDISSAAGEIREERAGVQSRERIDIFSSYLGASPKHKLPYMHVSQKDKDNAIQLIEAQAGPINGRKIILLGQNSNTHFRDIDHKKTKEVAERLAQTAGYLPVIVSELFLDNFNTTGVVELRNIGNRPFLGLVAISSLVVTPDTGTLHVAAALGVKTVSYFGPTHPQSRTSYYPNNISIWHRNKCKKSPCWYSNLGCTNRVCLSTVSTDELLSAINSCLNNKTLTPLPPRHSSLSLIIPVKDKVFSLYVLLDTIKRTAGFLDYEIIVVDNNSGHFNEINSKVSDIDPRIRVLQLDKEVGYGEACNKGAGLAKNGVLCFIDSQTFFRQPCLNRLLVAYDMLPDAEILGPTVVFPESAKIQKAGLFFDQINHSFKAYLKNYTTSKLNEMQVRFQVQAIGSECFAIKRNTFKLLEGFSTKYNSPELTTVDLCLRAASKKKKTYLVSNATIHSETGEKDPQYKQLLEIWQKDLQSKDILFNPPVKKKILNNSSLTILGPCQWADGLGRIALCVYEAAKEHIKTNVIHMPGGHDFGHVPGKYRNLEQELFSGHKTQQLIPKNVSSFVLTTGIPWTGITNHPHKIHQQIEMVKVIRRLTDKKRIIAGISMLESDQIPQQWVKQYNLFYDYAIVPSEFLVDVYKKCGVKIPIKVVPLPIYGLDESLSSAIKPFPKRPKPFVFGCLSGGWTRKNVPLLMNTFKEAFPKSEYPLIELKVHSRFGDESSMNQALEIAKTDNRIKYSARVMFEAELKQWKKDIHCLVLPTSGEGFSIPPREFLAQGIPCLITQEHAHRIVVEQEGALGIGVKGMRPAFYSYFGNLGKEWVPDSKDLREKMIYIYKNYLETQSKVLANRTNLSRYSFKEWFQESFVPAFGEVL